jgi:hypothetical protein
MQAAALDPFPDHLSPVFVRDLRQGLRANYFVWAFLLTQIAALFASFLEVSVSQFTGNLFIGGGPMQAVCGIVFGLALPMTLFGALQSEVGRGRNIELLLTSHLTRWQIVLGKFFVAATLSGILLVSILPYLLLRYFLGNVELTGVIGLVGRTYCANLGLNAIVIGASGFTSYIGRFFAIVYLLVLFGLTKLPAFFASLSILFATACMVALGLQLGRARLKLFEDPIDPPTSAGVFALAFLLPAVNGLAWGFGGIFASIVVMVILFFLSLRIDPAPSYKNRLKGAQP